MFSQLYVAATYFIKEGTLEGATTVLQTIDGRLGKFLKLTLFSSIDLFVLEGIDSENCADMSIVSKGYSIDLGKQRIIQYIMNISEPKKSSFIFACRGKEMEVFEKENLSREG